MDEVEDPWAGIEGLASPAERLRIRAPADLPGVEVLEADRSARRWELLHSTYTVCTILGIPSTVEWRYRGALHYHGADHVMLMEPGEVHANTHVTAPASFRVLFIEPTVVAAAAQALDLSATPHFRLAQISGATQPRVRSALLRPHDALESASSTLQIQERFSIALQRLLEECGESTSPF